jgi:hypothetical protein
MSKFDWNASEEVIDLYFIQSDMKDIEFSEEELYETAQYDAFAEARNKKSKKRVPLGKLVI